ncbi:MAG TPA: ABC transporter ATP-binding protein [Pseudolabrys sp.]|nr:ABC transporter ATP-binding protein [Pseudolabrys sp.]
MASSALSLSNVDAFYGDSHVLEGVSFELGEARMLGLLGRNGAGKSTCMNVTVGLLPPRRGTVSVFGQKVNGLPPEQIAARGVALVPQGRRIFRSLTVRENLIVAARKPDNGAAAKHDPWTIDTVFSMFPRLGERSTQMAAHLSGGEQQMLAIGRALMGNPSLLLMDEPLEGLAPVIVDALLAGLERLKGEAGLAMLLVEQHARLALALAENAIVLDRGRIVFSGPSSELLAAPERIEALMGVASASTQRA